MEFVTLATFSTSFDAAPYKVNLEHNGITCFLKDEHTMTMAPVYENAVGGIKLQVPREDFTKAKEIMIEAGYVFENHFELPPFWKWFDGISKKLPIVGNQRLVIRALFFLVPIAGVILFLIFKYQSAQ